MDYITPEKMRKIDRRTQEEFDIPVTILMENAGRAVFQTAMEMLREKEEKKVTVVCGRGNNGGDAFVAARHLMNNGIDVSIFLVAEVKELRGEAKANYHRAEKVAKTTSKAIEALNEEKNVVGGHLIKGIAEVTNEIVLLKTSLKFKRKLEESTGLQGMYLEEG